MSIWHNEPIPTDENKDVYVEFYTQIPYVDRETKSRCIVLASDCVELEEPDLIRWCYLDDLLNQQEEIKRLREALEFYAKEEHLKIDTRGNMKNKEDWEICGEADNYWNNGDKKYFYCEDGYKARKALNSKARENVN